MKMEKYNVNLQIPKSYKLRVKEKMAKYVSKDNEYYTPKEFVKTFGDFEYDPATTKEKAEEYSKLTKLGWTILDLYLDYLLPKKVK